MSVLFPGLPNFKLNFLLRLRLRLRFGSSSALASVTMAQLLGLPKGVSEQVEKMLELFPGQPADEKMMQQLWEYMRKDKSYHCFPCEGALLKFKVESCYHSNSDDEEEEREHEGDVLHMWLMSAPENDRRAGVEFLCYPASSEGLLRAIVDGKRYLKRYLDEGPCEGCATPHRKKLKLEGSQYCGSCVMKKALGV